MLTIDDVIALLNTAKEKIGGDAPAVIALQPDGTEHGCIDYVAICPGEGAAAKNTLAFYTLRTVRLRAASPTTWRISHAPSPDGV